MTLSCTLNLLSSRISRQFRKRIPASWILVPRKLFTTFFAVQKKEQTLVSLFHSDNHRDGNYNCFLLKTVLMLSVAFSSTSFATAYLPSILCHCAYSVPLVSGLKFTCLDLLLHGPLLQHVQPLMVRLRHLLMNSHLVKMSTRFCIDQTHVFVF